jgi:hypothetical protein
MRLRPTEGRKTLQPAAWPSSAHRPASPDGDFFGPFALTAERPHRDELRHLVAPEGRPPSLLLRRRPWPEDALTITGAARAKMQARMTVTSPLLPQIHEIGLLDGQIFELSDYVFGVDLATVSAAAVRLPWIAATQVFRELLQALTTLRSARCLPHRLLEARDLRLCLERHSPAVRLCQNRPLPTTPAELQALPGSSDTPLYGAQLRRLVGLMLTVSAPADATHAALLRDESPESADVLADHVQINDLPLDALSVAKLQFGSARNRRWLEQTATRGKPKLLGATDADREQLELFWRRGHELATNDRKVLDRWAAGRPASP